MRAIMTVTTGPAIRVRGLTKRYGDIEAVAGIDFDVAAGEIFGLLGPNGAGKTTTVEILEGLREPDGGTASVLGLDAARDADALGSDFVRWEKAGQVRQVHTIMPLSVVDRKSSNLLSIPLMDPDQPRPRAGQWTAPQFHNNGPAPRTG